MNADQEIVGDKTDVGLSCWVRGEAMISKFSVNLEYHVSSIMSILGILLAQSWLPNALKVSQ